MSTQPKSIIEKALSLLENRPLCNRCLGRQFAWLSTNSSNPERGLAIKLVLSMIADNEIKLGNKEQGKKTIEVLASNGMFAPAQKLAEKYRFKFERDKSCGLCLLNGESVFDRIPVIVERVADRVAEIEFDTFLAGCKPAAQLIDTEDELRAKFHILHGETLKSDFNREFGKQLRLKLGKIPDFEHPDLVIVYNMMTDEIELQISPIFIYGRYRKLQRGIPQSRWDCKECNGKGCEICKGTGRRYPDSIAEYIGEPMVENTRGSGYKFHAAGREDIDALMLGTGRPFVVEISQPIIRHPDLEKIAQVISERSQNKVEVTDLRMADRKLEQSLKEESSRNIKEYEALIQIEGLVTEEDLRRVERELTNTVIAQKTPSRVVHRRADKIREKHVYDVKLKKRDDGLVEGFFRVQGGTYIKELISGDNGRTSPSVTELLGTSARCVELNVTAVYKTESHHNA